MKDAKEWTAADMKKDLRILGFLFIVIGIIPVLAGWMIKVLDPIFGMVFIVLGIFAIVLGILAILIPRRGMFIMFGISLLLGGIMTMVLGELNVIRTIGAFIQLYFGVQEIRKFWKYDSSKVR